MLIWSYQPFIRPHCIQLSYNCDIHFGAVKWKVDHDTNLTNPNNLFITVNRATLPVEWTDFFQQGKRMKRHFLKDSDWENSFAKLIIFNKLVPKLPPTFVLQESEIFTLAENTPIKSIINGIPWILILFFIRKQKLNFLILLYGNSQSVQ